MAFSLKALASTSKFSKWSLKEDSDSVSIHFYATNPNPKKKKKKKKKKKNEISKQHK